MDQSPLPLGSIAMTAELYALVAALFVQLLSVAATGLRKSREFGFHYNIGPRDSEPTPSVVLARLTRATANGFEGLALFAPAVLIIAIGAQSSFLTGAAAWIYVLARLAYIPAYAIGLAPGRTIIWTIGAAATLILLVSALV